MIRKVKRAALLVAGGLALSGCVFGPNTAAPAKKPPAPDYQVAAASSPPAANIRAICYNEDDLATLHSRMLQMELSVATLQCQTPTGSRAFESTYSNFLSKFRPELIANVQNLQKLAARRRLNVDVVVTEFSNRMAQRAPVDKEFCSRSLRALEWALDPKVTSLKQAPPPYDLGPEMNIHPCPPK
jgi:hypothetical protein